MSHPTLSRPNHGPNTTKRDYQARLPREGNDDSNSVISYLWIKASPIPAASMPQLPMIANARMLDIYNTLYKYFKCFKLRESLAAGSDCLSVRCRVANESTELVHAVSCININSVYLAGV